MATIHKKVEAERGCGYRKKGGIYLVGGGLAAYCGKLPIPLTVCHCCGMGIKPSRSFTWISSDLFSNDCRNTDPKACTGCIFAKKGIRVGLIWVGEKFYSTPGDFVREAAAIGISRRIAQVPKDLELGKTWIAFAHRKAIRVLKENNEQEITAGIFHAFIPQRIEYVVTGNETEEELNAKEKRGFTLVDVVRDVDAQLSFLENPLNNAGTATK